MIITAEDTERKKFILNQLEKDYGKKINWKNQYDNIYFLLTDLEKQTNKGQISIPIIDFRNLRVYLANQLDFYPNYPYDKPEPMAAGLHSEEAAENHFFLHPETYGRLPNYDIELFYRALTSETILYQEKSKQIEKLKVLPEFLAFLKNSSLKHLSWFFA